MSIDNGSITRVTRRYIGKITTTEDYSTTKNASSIHVCEAKEDGVCCQSDATRIYPTSEGITRHLCDEHFYKLLRIIYAWYLLRCDERGAA